MITKSESIVTLIVLGLGSFVYFKAGERGRIEASRRSCMRNLEQIGIGFELYTKDYDGIFPRAWFGRNAGPSDAKANYKWMDAVFPYIKDEKLFTCPSDQVNSPYRFRSGSNYGSYVMNNAYSSPGDHQTPPSGINRNLISLPFSTMLLTEGENNFQVTWSDASHTPLPTRRGGFQLGSIHVRHGNDDYMGLPALDCGGMTSSSVLGFARDTTVIDGRMIYPKFTIERD